MWVKSAIRLFSGWTRNRSSAAAMSQVVALRSLALCVNIVTGLFVAAMLGPAGRGELAALLTAPGLLAGLASVGLHASLIYNMRAEPEHEREYLSNGMLLTFFLGIVVAIIGCFLEPYFLSKYSAHTILVGQILICSSPFTVITWTLIAASEVRGWFGFANRTLYLQSLSTLILLFFLSRSHALTPSTAAAAYTFPTLPVFVYFAYNIIRKIKPILAPRRYFLRRALSYGLRFCGVDLLATLAGNIDQVLVVIFLPPQTVGTYAVALSTSRLLNVIATSVVAVLFPKVAAGSEAVVVQTVTTTFRLVSLISMAIAIILALIGPTLLIVAYGAKFADAITPFRILLLAMVFSNGNGILYQIFMSCGRPGLVTILEGMSTGLLCCLMLVFVQYFGTVGAATAMLATACFRMTVISIGLRHFFKTPITMLVPGLSDIQMIKSTLLWSVSHPRTGAAKLGSVP